MLFFIWIDAGSISTATMTGSRQQTSGTDKQHRNAMGTFFGAHAAGFTHFAGIDFQRGGNARTQLVGLDDQRHECADFGHGGTARTGCAALPPRVRPARSSSDAVREQFGQQGVRVE